MEPVITGRPGEFIYGAPHVMEAQIGGLPCIRMTSAGGYKGVFSVWEFTDVERKLIADGANIELGILGREPIPPVSLAITDVKKMEG